MESSSNAGPPGLLASATTMSLNVFDYLERLPPDALDKLYGAAPPASDGQGGRSHGQWTCRALLQSLPQLAKQHVMRLLFVEGPVGKGMLKSWVKKEYQRVHAASVRKLVSLRVLLPSAGGQEYQLNPPFRENLQRALCASDKTPWQGDVPLSADRSPPTVAKIERQMHSQWQDVLYFLVGSDEEGRSTPPARVVKFMEESGLMRPVKGRGALRITDKGQEEAYEFMLKEAHVQAWMVVHALINGYGRTQPGCRDELLAFLFQLSYCKVGDAYPLGALTQTQRDLAQDFVELGLLFKRKAKSTRFYPTSIAVNLIFGSSPSGDAGGAGGGGAQRKPQPAGGLGGGKREDDTSIHIIVETNFQVIAYTRSKLHFAMLSLFLELRALLPNAIVGAITRESMRKALSTGIKGRQVLDFLKWHAHPVVRRRTPVVPENIADQVLLWERERDRMEHRDGVLVDVSYASRDAFRGMTEFANAKQGLLWSSPLGGEDEEGGGGGGGSGSGSSGGGLAGRKKLMVVSPGIVESLNAAIVENGWTSSF
ncbi:unnamed protein product [Ectocarpus sp. 6 AP-2014]